MNSTGIELQAVIIIGTEFSCSAARELPWELISYSITFVSHSY
jgi:hypothetical protein